MLYVKKLIELFQKYDSNCSIFSKELNCFDRQLGFKKFKNEIIEKNENRLKTSFNFFEKSVDQTSKSWYIITCRKASHTAERFRNQ